MDLTMEQRSPRGSSVDSENFWDERGPRTKYMAVSDACWLYQDRELEQNLRKLDWRKACKRLGNALHQRYAYHGLEEASRLRSGQASVTH
jgi:hypothetical protein